MRAREAVFLFDEGPGMGLGHRRRCEAIATELQLLDWTSRLVPLAGANRVAAPIVVVDSYVARADEMEIDAGLLVALDDLQRDLDVDVLIDPSPGADPSAHVRASLVLAGSPYALVVAPGRTVRPCAAGGALKRVLVTTGAADARGVGPEIAGAIRAALPDAEVRLVIGPWGAQTAPDGVVVINAPSSLAEEMAAAQIVVCAGGVTLLEACRLARATVAVTLAENQRTAVEYLQRVGAVLSTAAEDVASAVAELARDAGARRALSRTAAEVIDGLGPARVAEALVDGATARARVSPLRASFDALRH
jgi:spore coat polysaccharide biosynthesis predicted glycosyltransferase SpsG